VSAANARVLTELKFADRQDFEDATRGFIGTTADDTNPQQYQFLQQAAAPSTVDPSLWRLAQLNAINGLFKIADGVYQVRGFSLANMTIVEGATGVVVIDPLSTVGSARDAIDLSSTPHFPWWNLADGVDVHSGLPPPSDGSRATALSGRGRLHSLERAPRWISDTSSRAPRRASRRRESPIGLRLSPGTSSTRCRPAATRT
jgi:hypothetical protein